MFRLWQDREGTGSDAKGHTEEILPGEAATCTKEGLTDGVKCTVCKKILTPQKVIPKLTHKSESISAIGATCTKAGKTQGTRCSVCGEIIAPQKTVAALGHKWGPCKVTKRAGLTSDGIIVYRCTRNAVHTYNTTIPRLKVSVRTTKKIFTLKI